MSLYTIGHSTHDFDYFLKLLSAYAVNTLIDVRGVPYSKFAPAYNRGTIEKALCSANIRYLFMGDTLGAKTADISMYDQTGCMDFEKMSETARFKAGINQIKDLTAKGDTAALMCVEKEPQDCHRAILVSRALALNGVNAIHIMPDGSAVTQAELDARLLSKYFPNRTQLSLFGNPSDADYLRLAYNRRNRDIGYYLEGKANK